MRSRWVALALKASGDQSEFVMRFAETEFDDDSNGRTITGDGGETSSSSDLSVHSEPSLRTREGRDGRIRNVGGFTSLRASRDNGSLVHDKWEGGASSVDVNGQTTSSTPPVTTVLIKSNPLKLAKAMLSAGKLLMRIRR